MKSIKNNLKELMKGINNMTLIECYDLLNGSYENAKKTMLNDILIEKFILKFPMDTTMQELSEALASSNYELAFRYAHTMKGVAGNLAFTNLQSSVSELTEQLRNNKEKPDRKLVQNVENSYNLIIDVLKKYVEDR